MSLLLKGATQSGCLPYVEEIIIGVVFIAAVTLDRLLHGRRAQLDIYRTRG